MQRNVLIVIAIVLLAVWGIFDFVKTNEGEQAKQMQQQLQENHIVGIGKGEVAPDFTLMDIDGEVVSLSDFRGKNVILNFWATWCPPCKAEMPHMQKFWEHFNEKTVILAVNLTSTEMSEQDVLDFANNYSLTFPIVLDEQGETMRHYRIAAYPTSYVIDTGGIIREKFEGAVSYDTLKKTMARIAKN